MDSYVYIITALLPLAAAMLILQTNPYHALVIRGVLGAVAVLVYTVLGAADVALTEALVGTLLAVTLSAVAVRSSLVFRLGVLKEEMVAPKDEAESIQAHHFEQIVDDLRTIFGKHYLRVELVPYLEQEALHQALLDKEVHATCVRSQFIDRDPETHQKLTHPDQPDLAEPLYYTTTRLRRLYEIMQADLISAKARLIDANVTPSKETHL